MLLIFLKFTQSNSYFSLQSPANAEALLLRTLQESCCSDLGKLVKS